MNTVTWRICALTASVAAGVLIAWVQVATKINGSWDQRAAARYLDQREGQWTAWPTATRDHGTFCVSCHTAMPYALARPSLHATLAEKTLFANEGKLIDNVSTRVKLWKEVRPYYGRMPAQSRGTEARLF